MGRRDYLTKKIFFFYLVGSPKVGGAGDGKHKKKYGHPNGQHTNSKLATFSKIRQIIYTFDIT